MAQSTEIAWIKRLWCKMPPTTTRQTTDSISWVWIHSWHSKCQASQLTTTKITWEAASKSRGHTFRELTPSLQSIWSQTPQVSSAEPHVHCQTRADLHEGLRGSYTKNSFSLYQEAVNKHWRWSTHRERHHWAQTGIIQSKFGQNTFSTSEATTNSE